MRRKRQKAPAGTAPSAAKPSVVVGTEVDDAGFVIVTVTSPLGSIRYRVPADPLPVPARTEVVA